MRPESQSYENEEAPVRVVPPTTRTQLRRPAPWGLGAEDSGMKRAKEAERQGEAGQVEEQQTALWEQFEQLDQESAEQAGEQSLDQTGSLSVSTSQEAALHDVDYVSELPNALLNNAPDMVARCLFAASKRDDLDFIRNIPTTTFAECINILQPSNFTEKLANAHLELSEAVAHQFGITPMRNVAWEHSSMLKEILAIRRSAGIKLGLPEYRMLLRSARDLGDKAMASKLFSNLLNEGLIPDTACYNYYMAASVWSGIHDAAARYKVRVIPFTILSRRQGKPGPGFGHYRVGDGGVKSQVLAVFGEMLKHGAVADEESFRNVIAAVAREGDMSTVKALFRRVWDIDVDALQSGKNSASTNVKPVVRNSPLWPTSKLLFTIAHAFGINNDVPTALRVVDFVARKYDITIDLDVWNQLFEWTFVLSVPRTNQISRVDGSKTGELPKQSVFSLWETMTSSPYNIKPTIGMYNRLIKNLEIRNYPNELYPKMCEGLKLHRATRDRAYKAFSRLKYETECQEQNPEYQHSTSLETLRREWEHLDLLRRRNIFWCKRWLRLLLSTMSSWVHADKQGEWPLRQIPRILWDWRGYAPTTVRYESSGGTVELVFRTEEDIEKGRAMKMQRNEELKSVLERVPLFVGEDWVSRGNNQQYRRPPYCYLCKCHHPPGQHLRQGMRKARWLRSRDSQRAVRPRVSTEQVAFWAKIGASGGWKTPDRSPN